jgi:FAD/FMN-containing dehydrogenase
MLGFDRRADAFDAAWRLRRECDALEVVEFVSGPCMALVADTFGVAPPFAADAALLVEAVGRADPTGDLAAAIDRLGLAADERVAVASDTARRQALWRFRDELTLAIAGRGLVLKYDVSVPAPRLDDFCTRVSKALTSDGRTVWLFGHVCDDNVHVNVTGADDPAAVDDVVLGMVADHAGSISAEHGIGRAKAAHLGLARSPAEIAQMRAVKQALDPDNVLNPGVLFPS